MAIKTGQRTTENSSSTKTTEQRAKSRTTQASRNRASSSTQSKTVAKKDQGKAIELNDNPFNDEKVEIYNLNEADVERRENRAPAADPVKTVNVGKDGVFKVDGLKRGSYLAYAPDRDDVNAQNWLAFQSV
jgi:hypothetical protein